MKKVFLLFLLFIYLSPICLFSLHEDQLLTPSGVAVDLICRAFEPGEVIVVAIKDDPVVKDAWIRFLGRRYPMGKGETSSGLLAFIGLDLGLKQGSYEMEIFIDKALGESEYIKKQISILAKEFPLKKLWVDEKFVTPPPEFNERIKREREIIKVVYGITTELWLIFNNKPRSPHGGIDVKVPYGTPFNASNSGRVVLASDLYFAGKTVIIDHGMSVFTMYCHFSKIRVTRGKLVKKGEIIGEIGATGRVTGPHLHWGVKVSGISVDPFSILSLTFE